MATATRTRERVCPFCGQENSALAIQCIQCKQLLSPQERLAPMRPVARPLPYNRWVFIGLLLGCLPGALLYILAYSALTNVLSLSITGPVIPLLVGGEGIWAIITATGTQQKSRRLLAVGILIGLCISLLIRYTIPTTVYM
jgi:hypothetical protein